MRTPFTSEILEARRLYASSAALQPDGTLSIVTSDPETTIGFARDKVRVLIRGYTLEYIDPEHPDGQYRIYYNVVAKNFPADTVKQLVISTADDSSSEWGGQLDSGPLSFFKNLTDLPSTYHGLSITTDFYFGNGDDDVTDFAVNLYDKLAGRLILDYRSSPSPLSGYGSADLSRHLISQPPRPTPVVIYGTQFSDSFTTPRSNFDTQLYGGDGNDTIISGGGNDFIDGEAGDDVIYSGGGADSVYGGPGNDTVSGDAGDDLLVGEAGNDKLYGGAGNDKIFGGAGRDTLIGGAGNDRMNGQSGSDLYYANDNEADVLTDIVGGTNRAYADSNDRLVNVVVV